MEESKEDSTDFDKIKVFSSDDEKLKILGELLSNKSSRDIIRLLSENEMYTNEIAVKLDLRPNLVIHHLQKMKSIGLLEITNKKITRKGEEHRFFKIPSGIFIVPNESKNIKENGLLKRFFKNGIKFVAIGIAAVIPWIVTEDGLLSQLIEPGGKHTGVVSTNRPEANFFQNLSEIDPIVFSLFFIATGLALERILSYVMKKRKKRG